jgi:hypothetical protein
MKRAKPPESLAFFLQTGVTADNAYYIGRPYDLLDYVFRNPSWQSDISLVTLKKKVMWERENIITNALTALWTTILLL